MAEVGAAAKVRIFVSSPSDVLAERERVDRIAQRLSATSAGAIEIETVRWETDFYTADSTFQPQIVDPGSCDIVVIMFWQRLGSQLPPDFACMPDGRPYPSGTVYELSRALEARARSPQSLPDVLVYRKLADVAVSLADREVYREAHAQREAFLSFWEEWFASDRGHFKAAYNSFVSTDDFEVKFETHLREWLRLRGHTSRPTSWRLAEQGSPFCGLEAFDASHEEVFFGRKRDIDRALERLGRLDREEATRFLVLIGESGSGKSSLARAGIMPRILRGALGGEPGAWRAALMRPGAAVTPLLALAEALFDPSALAKLGEGGFSSPGAFAGVMGSTSGLALPAVTHALRRVGEELGQRLGSEQPPACRLVLLVDQLEELFAPTIDPVQRERFADTLDELAASDRVVVIATLRSDAYVDFTRSAALLALKEAGDSLDVTAPDAAEICEIVWAPAGAAGLRFGPTNEPQADRLDDLIIRSAIGRNALPLLQFTLSRLYDALSERLQRRGKTVVTAASDELVLAFEDYQTFGGLEGAIGERAEEAFRALPAQAQQNLPRLLRALAEAAPTDDPIAVVRGPRLFEVPWETLASDAPSASLVHALVAARILVASDSGDAHTRRVRLAHEAVLRSWKRAREIVTEHREFFRIRAEVAAAHRRYRHHRQERGTLAAGPLLLPRGIPLSEAEFIRRTFADELDPELVEFVDQSARRARRRQQLLGAVAILFAITALGAGAGAWFAVQSEQRASKNFDLAIAQLDAIVSTMSGELKDSNVSSNALRRLLSSVEMRFEEIARIRKDHPRLLLSRARMLTAFVDNYLELGETTEALRRAEDCVSVARGLLGRSPADSVMPASLATCLQRLGSTLYERGQVEQAIAAHQESVLLRRRVVSEAPADLDQQRELSASLRHLGYAYINAGRSEESLATLREALAIAKALIQHAGNDKILLRLLSDSLNTFAITLSQLRRHNEALAHYEESIALVRRLAKDDANSPIWRRYLSNMLANASTEMVALGRTRDALDTVQESIAVRRALLSSDPSNMAWQRELSFILVDAGNLLVRLERSDDALTAYREAVGIVRRLLEIDPSNVAWKNELRRRLPPVAHLLAKIGKRDEAILVLRESLALFREAAAANPDDAMPYFELGWLASYLGEIMYLAGRNDEAAVSYAEALAAMRRYTQMDAHDLQGQKNLALILSNYGRVLRHLDRRSETTEVVQESIRVWRQLLESEASAPNVLLFVGTLREFAAIDPSPRSVLAEALRWLKELDKRGELTEAQRQMIGSVEAAINAL